MKLNGKKIKEIMDSKKLTVKDIFRRTGLYEKSFQWILENEYASDETMERIADSLEMPLKEITMFDSWANHENCIEFLKYSDLATVSFTREKFANKIRKLAKNHPDECQIVAENKDGSICARIPVSWVKVSPKRAVSDKQREASSERFKRFNSQRTTTREETE